MRAPAIHRALRATVAALADGASDRARLEAEGWQALTAAAMKPDYYTIRRAVDLGEPVAGDRELVVLTAARLGNARLIDNLRVTVPLR